MIAYVRIPKTASCTILDAIAWSGVRSIDHASISAYPDADATFTFVRNPWERLFSWYRHCKFYQSRSFEEYVLGEEKHPMHPVAPTQFYRHGNANQTDMLVADQSAWWRERRPTYIGKFENLGRDLECIGSLLGFSVQPIQHLNRTESTDQVYTTDLWTDEMVERMAPIFDPFAAEFGYEVDPC